VTGDTRAPQVGQVYESADERYAAGRRIRLTGVANGQYVIETIAYPDQPTRVGSLTSLPDNVIRSPLWRLVDDAPPDYRSLIEEIDRLRSALRVCEVVLHNGAMVIGALGGARTDALLHAGQQASGAHATDWTPERILDDVTDATDPRGTLRRAALGEPNVHRATAQR
jgi:hypothetical protein